MSGDGSGGVFGIIAFQRLWRLPAPIRFSKHDSFFLSHGVLSLGRWSTFARACTHITTRCGKYIFLRYAKSGILNSLTVTFNILVIRKKLSSSFS